MSIATMPAEPGTGSTQRIGVTVGCWAQAFANWRGRRRSVHDLRALDSRILKDIGIDRSEITSIVHGDGYGRRRIHADD